MANWRELGEVPDSEDEDFDSQELQETLLPPTRAQPTSERTTKRVKDVWDIPSSQDDELGQPAAQEETHLPQTSLPGPQSLQQHIEPSPAPSSVLSDPPPDLDSQSFSPISKIRAPELAGHGDQDSVNDLLPSSPTIIGPPSSQAERLISSSPASPPPNRIQSIPEPSQILGYDQELQDARRLAISYERSFRARKPEQLRPYHTERTRFNTEWRQHGLRPVRIANDDDRQRNSEELLEAEFEPATQESASQQAAGESQTSNVGDGFLHSQLRLASSSPSKSSNFGLDRGRSSQQTALDDTDGTSVNGEDLPSLEDLASKRPRSDGKQYSKHRIQSRRRADAQPARGGLRGFIVPPASPGVQDPFDSDEHDAPASGANAALASPSSKTIRREALSSHADALMEPLLIDSDSDGVGHTIPLNATMQAEDDETTTSEESSDSDSEVVTKNSRRIKGVLPASWLRLDQKSTRTSFQQRIAQPIGPPQSTDHRRGVAQRKESRPTRDAHTMLEDLLETSEASDNAGDDAMDNVQLTQPKLTTAVESLPPIPAQDISDDASAIEFDSIEPVPGIRKRQMKLTDAFQREPKRAKTSKQARALPPNAQRSTTKTKTHRKKSRAPAARMNKTAMHRDIHTGRHPAPQLSILDVIEPDAPKFLRVAARTVQGRRDKGRGSPSRKLIQLASRDDHIDATGILRDWALGSIAQRPSVSVASGAKPPGTRGKLSKPPLKESTGVLSQLRNGALATKGKPRSPVGGAVAGSSVPRSARTALSQRSKTQYQAYKAPPLSRVAQLEAHDTSEASRHAFHAGKRLLDRIYRHNIATTSGPSSALSATALDDSRSPHVASAPRHVHSVAKGSLKPTRRKQTRPQRIDVEAPQYSRANDPLPLMVDPHRDPSPTAQESERTKLRGLGPYGTQYTHHFEVFPLPGGVFFHDTTLIGSGVIDKAARHDYFPNLKGQKPPISFALGAKILEWGLWNATVASELGVLVDHISDQLHASLHGLSPAEDGKAIAGIAHILSYMGDSMSFKDDSDMESFISRILESFTALNARVAPLVNGNNPLNESNLQPLFHVYDYILLISHLCLQIARGNQCLLRQRLSVEDLLKSTAGLSIKVLLHCGIYRLRRTYRDLTTVTVRERGLRNEDGIVQSWVIVMKVLGLAQMPRGSFWDLFQRIALAPELFSGVDARLYEGVWEKVFILLPLTEFDYKGLVVPGKRHVPGSDGWALLQRLMKPVFQLYQENKRQPPSFNNYCRALVGRCHYLVEQWGWHRCASIVGVVFDFFGAQDLAHLRNEEVYQSPRFLEELSHEPSLKIEAEDRCFHIFLKLIALGILNLRKAGSSKDIRNLVARVIPNHNRQFLRDQQIHQHELAALRNHHDLLCTLFWASPPEIRPNTGLIERLVIPADSHKEACLINLRAWSQLSRFIVSSGEATTSFKPFNSWRNSFFQQTVDQLDSVAPDIKQQLQALSKDVSKSIDSGMVDAMIVWNKAALLDILHASVVASLDVMRHASDLEASSFCLNTWQLQQVFQSFSSASAKLDWTILQASLGIMHIYLERIDEFKNNQESQESESQILNSAQADDALLVLSHDIANQFFSMASCILSTSAVGDPSSVTASQTRKQCIEQAVVLSTRLGIRFTEAGIMQISDMFKQGNYALFRITPEKLSLAQRKYFPVFVATLFKYGFNDWSRAGFNLLESWLLSIVKPQEALAFEMQLAKAIILHGGDFVPEAVNGIGTGLDYNTNRDLFAYAISSMRRSIRDVEPTEKKNLVAEYGKALKLVMDLIKADLHAMSRTPTKHQKYIIFVREVIALIRAHGSEFCVVDDFFYQINSQYSPSQQDPQLQVAAMASYGIRLAEGDSRIGYQLFFLLFNQIKLAVASDKLRGEALMLCKGMRTKGILDFILGKMFPAIVVSSQSEESALPLLDTYTQAFYLLFESDVDGPQLLVTQMEDLSATLRAMVGSIVQWDESCPSNEKLHIMRQCIAFLNFVWPSIHAISLSPRTSVDLRDHEVFSLLKQCHDWTMVTEERLWNAIEGSNEEVVAAVPSLNAGSRTIDGGHLDNQVTSFADSIVKDIRQNWVTLGNRLTIQTPTLTQGRKPGSSPSKRGVEKPTWKSGELRVDLYERIRECNIWWDRVFGANRGAAYRITAERLALF